MTRISLVLGAGGSAGAHWIRGSLAALAEISGFRPEHAHTIVGTSIGAIKAAGFGPHTPPSESVVANLLTVAEVPSTPTPSSRLLVGVRHVAGRALAVTTRSGTADSYRWVEHIHENARARVVSVQQRPPRRRAIGLDDVADVRREIAASAAVPFAAASIEIDGRPHIDGAVWSVTNADLARPETSDLLIVIAPLVATDGGTPVSALGRHQLRAELTSWGRAAKPVLVIAPSGTSYANRDAHDGHEDDARRLVATLFARVG